MLKTNQISPSDEGEHPKIAEKVAIFTGLNPTIKHHGHRYPRILHDLILARDKYLKFPLCGR